MEKFRDEIDTGIGLNFEKLCKSTDHDTQHEAEQSHENDSRNNDTGHIRSSSAKSGKSDESHSQDTCRD